MKDAARLLLYLAGVLLVGALGAPLLSWLGQFLGAHRILPILAKFDFESYFHRALLIAAVGLLWPLLASLAIRHWRDLGLRKNSRANGDIAAGFLIASVPLLCCGAVLIVLQIYSLRPSFLWHKMPEVALAAIFASIVEEFFFRGLILGVLLRRCSGFLALLLTSVFFSIIHFLKTPDLTTPKDAVSWTSGFVSIAHSFSQFADPVLLLAGFLTLFVLGGILADARLQTHSLWLPIGLHAGWVFANGVFSKAAHREALALPWIGKDLLVGIAPLIIALVSWALMRGWIKYVGARSAASARRIR